MLTNRSRLWRRGTLALMVSLGSLGPWPGRLASAQGTDGPAVATARDQAREKFKAGTKHFGEERWEEALAAFEASYDLVASPNSALMSARCLAKLGRVNEAMIAFGRSLAEAGDAPKYAQTKVVAEAEQQALRDQIARVIVRVPGAPAGTTVRIGNAVAPMAGDEASLWVEPGSIEVRVEAPGQKTTTRELRVRPGGEAFIELATGRQPAGDGANRGDDHDGGESASGQDGFYVGAWLLPATIVAGGVGVVGMAMFIGFGVSNQSTYDDLEQTCAPNCGPAFDDRIAAGERDGLIANISLGVGAVGLAAAAVFGTLYLTQDAEVSVGPAEAHLRIRF